MPRKLTASVGLVRLAARDLAPDVGLIAFEPGFVAVECRRGSIDPRLPALERGSRSREGLVASSEEVPRRATHPLEEPPLSFVSTLLALVGAALAFVGAAVAFVGDAVALVGKTLAFVGDLVAFVGRALARFKLTLLIARRG